MGRGKVEFKAIENPITRKVTFGKRKTGLFKKAEQISVMCDAEVALITFSAGDDQLFIYATDSRMEQILERYERYSSPKQLAENDYESQVNWSEECSKLLSKVKVLERTMSHLVAEDMETLSLRELQKLQHKIETALKRVRAKKNLLMNQSISEHQKKEKALRETNKTLKMKTKHGKKPPRLQLNLGLRPSSPFFALPPPPPPPLFTGETADEDGDGRFNGAFESDTTILEL